MQEKKRGIHVEAMLSYLKEERKKQKRKGNEEFCTILDDKVGEIVVFILWFSRFNKFKLYIPKTEKIRKPGKRRSKMASKG